MKHLARPVRTGLALVCLFHLAASAPAQDQPETDSTRLDYWRGFVRNHNPQLDPPAQEKLALELQQNARRTLEVQQAFEAGDAKEFARLMENSETRRQLGPNGRYLIRAVEKGDVELTTAALELGLDEGLTREADWSPLQPASVLHIAAASLDLPMVKLLLEHGAEVNALDFQHRTPLELALLTRDAQAVVPINAPGQAFIVEFNRDHRAVAEALLAKGARVFVSRRIWRPIHPLLRRPQSATDFVTPGSELTRVTLLEQLLEQGRTDAATWLVTNQWAKPQRTATGDTALHEALAQGLHEAASLLIRQRLHLNVTNQAGWTPLHVALDQGNKVMTERLVEAGSSVDAFAAAALGRIDRLEERLSRDGELVRRRDGHWRSLLHWAAIRGELASLKWLLEHGADTTARAERGDTALHLAVRGGWQAAVRSLLDRGADPNARNSDALTPMLLAAANGDLPTMQLLHAAGADPALKLPSGTALHWAAYHGHLPAVTWLLDQQVPVNVRNRTGLTALAAATLAEQREIVDELLRRGASPTADGVAITTALHLSAGHGDLEAVRQLLDQGADIDARSEQGETALHLATRQENLSLMRLLINAGADREIANAAGLTPLLLAAELEPQARLLPAPDFHPFLRWVKNVPEARAWIATNLPALVPRSQTLTPLDYLLARRANPRAVNTNGESALHLAWTGYRVDPVPVPEVDQLVATLVRAGVSPDAQDRTGRTPLHLVVAERGGWAKAHALLQAGANPDARDQMGRTPLHAWMLSDFPDEHLATLLLTNRANLNAQDQDGNTPLHLALYKTFVGPVDFLVKHGADLAIANHAGRSPLMIKETRGFGGGFGMAALRPPGASFATFRQALETGPAAEVALWLQTDPKLTQVEYPLGETPLLLAERRGDRAIVELVRRHQAGRPSIKDGEARPEGTSPFPRGQIPQFVQRPEPLPGDLLAAALRGDTGEVMTAVKSRPDLLRLEQQSETLLIAAARKGHHELVLALLKAGADPLLPEHNGRTALYHAWQLEDQTIAQALLEHGAREDIHGMAAAGKLDWLRPLLQAHPDWLSRTNARGYTVLHSAAFNGQTAVAEWLLDHGGDLEHRTADHWGWTPLHCAVHAGQLEMMTWLIQRGADVRTKDHTEKTLLHEALLTRNLELVGPLLELGLPLNAVDQPGHTPLDYARFIQGLPGGPELYERLKAAGATNGPGPHGRMGSAIPAAEPTPGRPAR